MASRSQKRASSLSMARYAHALVSRLAENPDVSEETIRALAGHLSQQMLARYSRIGAQAKRDAIRRLETSLVGDAGDK